MLEQEGVHLRQLQLWNIQRNYEPFITIFYFFMLISLQEADEGQNFTDTIQIEPKAKAKTGWTSSEQI